MNLYFVNVIVPDAKPKLYKPRIFQTKVLAPDESTARRLAVTKCPQTEGTLAYGEVVRCFLPLPAKVGDTRPSSVAPVVARRHPSLQEGGRRPRKNVPAPVTTKRIPAPPVVSFLSDSMSFGEASLAVVGYSEVDGFFAATKAAAAKAAAKVRADIAAEIDREEAGSVDGSNFLVSVSSAYDVESDGWDGWKVSTR